MTTRILPTLALVLLITGCATATPYQRAAPARSSVTEGYVETRIEPVRYRVSFRGNSLTSRETVELYLLYRAAELTLEQGFDSFQTVARSTDESRKTLMSPSRMTYPGWQPYWSLYGARWQPGWRHDPFLDPAFDYREVRSYESQAEIVMFRGAQPAGADMFDARQVQTNLASKIMLPPTR